MFEVHDEVGRRFQIKRIEVLLGPILLGILEVLARPRRRIGADHDCLPEFFHHRPDLRLPLIEDQTIEAKDPEPDFLADRVEPVVEEFDETVLAVKAAALLLHEWKERDSPDWKNLLNLIL